ncbi:hypothetical protein BCR34DRAFT_130826 [Clohesyomyces aquaticus]|uniref:Uncharacterized protein n=1 Tax=Clohesyomyces aquaticus TaxID=1231657 RepID=A0A1Y2AAF0_9PLEO|nr:hypothetical protein BCR34DRAFT_130826 [Clohesyomyces aquaticus]
MMPHFQGFSVKISPNRMRRHLQQHVSVVLRAPSFHSTLAMPQHLRGRAMNEASFTLQFGKGGFIRCVWEVQEYRQIKPLPATHWVEWKEQTLHMILYKGNPFCWKEPVSILDSTQPIQNARNFRTPICKGYVSKSPRKKKHDQKIAQKCNQPVRSRSHSVVVYAPHSCRVHRK